VVLPVQVGPGVLVALARVRDQEHLWGVTGVLQWCYSGVTVVLHWCYSGVTVVLQWPSLVSVIRNNSGGGVTVVLQ
jgi:hypothetical protein